ncbi:MAG: hypothetical protein K8S54_00855 [Spirochaetia bacterium]|nr:hypothetical protein [Spirochaetia bacterium]
MRFLISLTILTFGLQCASFSRVPSFPRLESGRVIFNEGGTRPTKETTDALLHVLRELLLMVEHRDWSKLPDYVSKKKGIYVDLKGYRSFQQLAEDVKDRNGYLYLFYHDTAALRAGTGDKGQIAVRDLVLNAGTIRVDFFMEEGSTECEMKLSLEETPKESYRMNQPVFILEDGQWKVYRLF